MGTENLTRAPKGVVDSNISHLAESSDNQLQARVRADDEKDELRGRSEFEAPSNDPHGLLYQRQSTPEQALLEDESDARITAIFKAVAGQPDLAGMVEAIMEVDDPMPKAIAEHLGVPVSEVNNRLKRLRRLALKLTSKQQDEAHFQVAPPFDRSQVLGHHHNLMTARVSRPPYSVIPNPIMLE